MKVKIDNAGESTPANPTGLRVMLNGEHRLPKWRTVNVSFNVGSLPEAYIEAVMLDSDLSTEADAEVKVTTLPSGKRYRMVPLDEGDWGAGL